MPPPSGPSPVEELDPTRPLTERGALGWLPHTCFVNGPPGRTGIELELLVVASSPVPSPSPLPRRRHDELAADLREQPLASALTVEPGGQLELSTPPAPDVVAATAALRADLERVRGTAARHDLQAQGIGLDPHRRPRRLLDAARYRAMEEYFDRSGPHGRLMMCSTASIQVNVESGTCTDTGTGTGNRPGTGTGNRTGDEPRRRWQLLHEVGPALVAAFAHSPLHRGRPTGWVSSRQAVWAALDPRRTRAPQVRPGDDIGETWARWALDAPLLLVRREHGRWTAPPGVTFRDWLRHGCAAVPDRPAPTRADLEYHLTTLFPPVRARGHLEVRYLDAQPGDWWSVPAAVVAALVDHPGAADRALDACARPGVRGRWTAAARHGVHDDDLRRAATRVLAAAAGQLRATVRTSPLGDQVEAFLDRWTLRGRCPADDVLGRGPR